MSAEPKPSAPAAADAKRNRLGRGLAALIGDAAAEEGLFDDRPAAPGRAASTLPIEMIRANSRNPRRNFAEDELTELARSIQEKGLLQPLIVRPLADADGMYEVVAGERRWRAAQLARLHEVPVVIRPLSDAEALEIAIIENVQRSDLNAVEEAAGYQRLMEEFDYTQEALSKVIGKSRSHVANTLRLVHLPDKVRRYVTDGLLSAGHARALLGADNPEALANMVVQKGLSVREAEALAKGEAASEDGAQTGGPRAGRMPRAKDANTRALESDLARAVGLKVAINHRAAGDGAGTVTIAYKTLEQLDDVCWRLMAPRPKPAADEEEGAG